jgi:hypothetical protein
MLEQKVRRISLGSAFNENGKVLAWFYWIAFEHSLQINPADSEDPQPPEFIPCQDDPSTC